MGELSPIFEDRLLLAFDSEVARENPSAILVTYGSTFLDEMARKAANYGRYTILYGPDPGSKPGERLEREIRDKVEFVRCRPPKVVHQWLEEHSYRGFYFRAVFRSYERTEGMVAVVVDGTPAWWRPVLTVGGMEWWLSRNHRLLFRGQKPWTGRGYTKLPARMQKDRPGSAPPPSRPR